MSESKYYLSFDHLASAITKGKQFSPNDAVDINDDIFDNKELFYNFSNAHRSFAYLITSEYIHEQILPTAIKQAFVDNVNHSAEKNDCDYLKKYFDVGTILQCVDQISEEETTFKSDKSKVKIVRDEDKQDLSHIFPTKGISGPKLESTLKEVISVIGKYNDYNSISDESNNYYAAILKVYLPEIVFSLITNYTEKLGKQIEKITKSVNNKREVDTVIKKLCHPSVNISIYGDDVREISKTVDFGVKAFKYTMIHNAILRSSKDINFALSFIWYERNVGTYQFYLTRNEYAEVVSKISGFEPNDSFKKMSIEKSVVLYKILKENCNSDFNALVRYTADCLRFSKDSSEYDDIFEEPYSPTQLGKAIEEYIEAISQYPLKDDLKNEMHQLLDGISNDELSQRISTTLINFIFYNDIWNRENFVVPKSQYIFKCESIKSTLWDMSNVSYSLWIVDMNADCPDGLKKISYSSSLDMLYPLKALYVGESIRIEYIKVPECILVIEKSCKISNESPKILLNMKKAPCKKGIFHLKQAEFRGITIERTSSDELDLLYRHDTWVELFNRVNNIENTDKIFFGIHYYLNDIGYGKIVSEKNISANAINSIEDPSDLSSVYNNTSAQDYEDRMIGSFQPYKGICSSNTFSSNSSRLISSCGIVSDQPSYNEPGIRINLYKKYSDKQRFTFENDKATQIIDFPYTNDIATGFSNYHLMDIYYPLGASKEKYPVIVTVNGEFWCFNDKSVYSSYGRHLSSKGFAVVNFNYRLGSGYKYPEGLIDVCRLMDHINTNADLYKLDLSQLYMIGNCTGAHLAVQYSVLASNPEYRGLFNPIQDLQLPIPKKIALNNGIYKFDENTPYLSLYIPDEAPSQKSCLDNILDYINKDFPPAFIAVNANDPLRSTAYLLEEKLSKQSKKPELEEFGLMDESLQNDYIFDATSNAGKKCNNMEIEFFRAKN
ncbi:MAG: alpha/beta hydrolase [Oscillospiraceae bacterium]